MISLDTLLFPDTDIFKDSLYPLMLFSSPLYYLQPIESVNEDETDDEIDTFMESGLCQAYTPAPLGENRDRFLRLIKDIRERKDDYAAQLSLLTVAAMSQPASARSGESRHEIVSSLLKGFDVTPAQTADDIELWQARLVLEIADMLDKDEDELQQHLHLLDSRELEMFRELQGDNGTDRDDPFAELEALKEQRIKARPQEMKQRFNAWLRLMKNNPLPQNFLWLASSTDSGDQIINRYEQKSSELAIPVLKLTLPAKIAESPRYVIDQITRFHQDVSQIHQALISELSDLTRRKQYDPSSPETLLPGNVDWAQRWENSIDTHFPESSHGRSALTFFLLANQPIPDLLTLDSRESLSAPALHGLLTVLNR